MSNPDKKLGEKIRHLRLQLGITQRDLAGDKITRNMLSLIESGTASPSVSTLVYIAERLETPAGYFFTSTEEDEGRFLKMNILGQLKECFRAKKYRECEEICAELPPYAFDDELSYMLAVSFLGTACEFASALNLRSAMTDLDKAQQYAEHSLYVEEHFQQAIRFYRELFRSVCSDQIPDILCDQEVSGVYVSQSVIQYFRTLRRLHAGEAVIPEFVRGSYHDKHISALIMLREDRISDAQKRLRELSLDSSLPYYMQYRVLTDLEEAANTTGDFRLAYSSARRKLEFIDRFKI
ncbi:MAG: helix-turn-helix transcriptional regulator [Clostridia bacterium]|nr:helix-turn-helix transcriptional regulator [Clostridia bacterium]